MKRILALLLALLMLLSLTACGGDDSVEDTNDPAEGAINPEPKPEAKPEPEVKPEPEPEPEPEIALTMHENLLFTVGYNEEEGWIIEEDDIYLYDDGGHVTIKIPDEDGFSEAEVMIYAAEDTESSFRESMFTHNIDMQAYVAGTIETVDIGGLKMLEAPRGENGRFFFGRNESAGVYAYISTYEYDDPRVVELIQNVTFTISDGDNVDPPWPWEGEPFTAGTLSQMVGDYTVTAEFLPMSEQLITYDTFNHSVEVLGDKVYILSEVDKVMREYLLEGSALTLTKEIPMDPEYSVVESANGALVLSRTPGVPVITHDGESVLKSYEGTAKLYMAPDGTWGISSTSGGDKCEKIVLGEEGLTRESFPLNEVKQIRYMNVDDQYIYVSGMPQDTTDHIVFIYNHAGELQMTLDSDPNGNFGLGSITYMAKTKNGFLGIDANFRDVVLWAADGTWQGSIDGADLFGTNYPWISNADVMDDGSLLVIMTEERSDGSAIEVIAYKVTVS